MTLTLHAAGWSGTDYRVHDAAGQEIAFLDLSSWRTAGTLTTLAATFSIRRDDLDGALIVAGPDGLPVAQATKPSMWSSEYLIEWLGAAPGDRERARLHRPSMWRSGTFTLDDTDTGERLATLTRRGVWRSRIEVDAPGDWPLERVLFVAAIMAFVQRAEGAAAAGG